MGRIAFGPGFAPGGGGSTSQKAEMFSFIDLHLTWSISLSPTRDSQVRSSGVSFTTGGLPLPLAVCTQVSIPSMLSWSCTLMVGIVTTIVAAGMQREINLFASFLESYFQQHQPLIHPCTR